MTSDDVKFTGRRHDTVSKGKLQKKFAAEDRFFAVIMVQTCVAYNCGQRHNKGDPPFHRFPKNVVRRKRWIVACRFENYEPSKNDRICSNHFLQSDYKSSGRLNNDAVPSIFSFPGHLLQSTAKRKAPADRSFNTSTNDSVTSTSDDSLLSTSSLRRIFCSHASKKD